MQINVLVQMEVHGSAVYATRCFSSTTFIAVGLLALAHLHYFSLTAAVRVGGGEGEGTTPARLQSLVVFLRTLPLAL